MWSGKGVAVLLMLLLAACNDQAAGPVTHAAATEGRQPEIMKCIGEDPDVAIVACSALIDSGWERPVALSMEYARRGFAYAQKNNYTMADEDAVISLKINPNSVPGHLVLGLVFINKRNPTLAIYNFDAAIRLDPRNDSGLVADILTFRAVAYLQVHKQDEAIRDFNQSLSMNPMNPMLALAFVDLGMIYAQAHQYDLAVANFSSALAVNPAVWTGYYERAAVYIRTRQLPLAIADLNKAVAANPKWAFNWSERCRARTLAGDYAGASTDCRRALQLDLTSSLSANAHGLVSLKLGNPTAAINDYTYALSIDPKSPSALYGRGLARRMAGDELSATQDIAAATALDPDIAEEFASYGLSAAEADLPFEVSTSKAAPDY